MTLRITYVIPVHNSAITLPSTLEKLASRLADFPGSEIILVENGSTDESAQIISELAPRYQTNTLSVLPTTSEKGLGLALRKGIELAKGDVTILSASDLPFGFTDLDQLLATAPRPQLALGSKAHPQSRIEAPLLRRIMSQGFRLMRRVTLGLRIADSQGTVLIDTALAQQLAPHLECHDFLISTEIACWAIKYGVTPVELPVVYPRSTGKSTVSPLGDSVRMAWGLLALRHRLHKSETRPR